MMFPWFWVEKLDRLKCWRLKHLQFSSTQRHSSSFLWQIKCPDFSSKLKLDWKNKMNMINTNTTLDSGLKLSLKNSWQNQHYHESPTCVVMWRVLCPQDDKDLVPEFVASEGLTCFIKVGAEADHNYQNYILRGETPPSQDHRGVKWAWPPVAVRCLLFSFQ